MNRASRGKARNQLLFYQPQKSFEIKEEQEKRKGKQISRFISVAEL